LPSAVVRAVENAHAVSTPKSRDIIAKLFLHRRFNHALIEVLDGRNRQPRPRLAPGRIRELSPGQMSNRGTRDIALRDLLNEQRQRLIGSQHPLARSRPLIAKMIVMIRLKKISLRKMNASECGKKCSSHPWRFF